MTPLLYFSLLLNLGCFHFVGSHAVCIDFIGEKRQREGSFAKVSPIGAERCVEMCELLDTCFAVNYFRLNATCQFLNRTMPESKLVKADKCMYKSVRSPLKESIDKDPCYQKLCPWEEICVNNSTTNLAECYPFCRTPPEKSWTINETIEAEVGQNYSYRCRKGLIWKSGQNPTVTCLHNGSWTSTNVTCGILLEHEYRTRYQSWMTNTSCKRIEKRRSLRTSEWVKSVCKSPPTISGTINETSEVEVGQNYTYKCQDGLSMKSGLNPTVKCLQDGSWSATNFSCVCKTPPKKSRTINETVEIEVGQNYTYRCQNITFSKGGSNPTITCQDDGNWTSSDLVCVKQNWTLDTIYPNNIHNSDVISNKSGIDLLACMQQCDDKANCLSFFYDNHTGHCVLSSSFRRGLPQGFQFSDELFYYTGKYQIIVIQTVSSITQASLRSFSYRRIAPSATCDMNYRNVTLNGSYFCVKYYSDLLVFNVAMKICESEKAKLLVITTQAQIADAFKTFGSGKWHDN
ncbi:hypothetical protein CHS0354_014013 [Potamilus streckersoni]|uniref:Uncharacterized protein n=1 Tax=Potamilus streckersoni TaxID=2493646 RepID=A0AAE0WE41_9BIVA|nr:hypothetical protein CHS0354_014013 [Potamilus streckersoni]